MKRLIGCLLLIMTVACTDQPSQVNISGTVKISENGVPAEVMVGLFDQSTRENLGQPIEFIKTVTGGSFKFSVEPGAYTLAAWAKGYVKQRAQVLGIEPGNNTIVNFKLAENSLHEHISSVKIVGDFCDWSSAGALNLDKGVEWQLKDKSALESGSKYAFMVNEGSDLVYDLSQSNVVVDTAKTTFVHVYSGGDVVFNSSSFPKIPKKGNVEISGKYSDFEVLVDSLSAFSDYYRKVRVELRNATMVQIEKAYTAINEKLDALDQQFGGKYAQQILEMRLSRTTYLHPVFEEVSNASENDEPDVEKLGEVISGPAFADFKSRTDKLISQIDLTYPALTGSWISGLAQVDSYFEQAPDALAKLGMTPDYFGKKLIDLEASAMNRKVGPEILYYRAWILSYDQKVAEAEPLLMKLKEKYPESDFVTKGRVDVALTSLKMISGIEAPLFEVELIDGKTFKLADQRGKFVFLDFWGTWCGPCRQEIPNIIKMAKHFPNDRLQVAGLTSRDTKEQVVEYVAKNGIPYPNALGPADVVKEYGITAFPTTFLIAPDGKIIAKNLRGSDLIEKVESTMKAWTSKKDMSMKG